MASSPVVVMPAPGPERHKSPRERLVTDQPTSQPDDGIAPTIDQDVHYTPGEIARRWHVSPNTARRLFEHEPGVLHITAAPERRNRSPRRRHMTQLRIPARVAQRVHAQLSAA